MDKAIPRGIRTLEARGQQCGGYLESVAIGLLQEGPSGDIGRRPLR